MRRGRSIGLAILLFIGILTPSDPVLAKSAPTPASDEALVLLASQADLHAVVENIRASGGRVTHIFPPAALIGEVPVSASLPVGVRALHRQVVDEEALSVLNGEARCAAQIWNALLSPEAPPETAQSLDTLGAELVGDAMNAPAPEGVQTLAASDDPTPGYAETSEYFIGRVAVGIVLPESDGSVDDSTEDWTEDERARVLSEITAALDWWAAQEPDAHLTFVYDDGTSDPVPTGYEPIGRPQDDQSLWIGDVMEKKGYTGSSYFGQVREYNNDLRDEYDTDWAFTIFVVDSSNDDDNRFADEYFAYAYLGGPFTVMTYGNNGYGPQNMDAVAAHEIGHIFLALDQYDAAHQPCTRQSGYLGVENQNSEYGDCASDEASIMRGHTRPFREGAIDEYARGQIGWRDSDGDGIFDPVDTTLRVTSSSYVTDTSQSNILTFVGSVRDDPAPSPLRRDTVINTIDNIHYRVAGEEWIDAVSTSGGFDAYQEDFTFTTPPLPTGEWTVELHVIDSAGNELTQTLTTVTVVDPVDEVLDTTLTRSGQQVGGSGEEEQVVYNGVGVSAVSYVSEVYYRIDDGEWQAVMAEDGVFDESEEEFSFAIDLSTLDPGDHQVQAYSVDGEGNTETSPASDSVHVEPSSQYVFLPLVRSDGQSSPARP